jgi:ATP/maltotriose-dependent transcriptional regulator MalT
MIMSQYEKKNLLPGSGNRQDNMDEVFGYLKTNVKSPVRDSHSMSFDQLKQLLSQVNNSVNNISIFVVALKSEELSSLHNLVNPVPLQITDNSKINPANLIQRKIENNLEDFDISEWQEAKRNRLTQREGEILTYMAKGFLNKQIAFTFSVSEQTIKNQVTSILRKLGAESRTGAVANAVMKGLISFPTRAAVQS